MSRPRFDDLPGAADYLERRRQMLARHERERHELAERQMAESQSMTEEFRASLPAGRGETAALTPTEEQ